MNKILPEKNALYSSLAHDDLQTAKILLEQGYYFDLTEKSLLLSNLSLINYLVDSNKEEIYNLLSENFNWYDHQEEIASLIKQWGKAGQSYASVTLRSKTLVNLLKGASQKFLEDFKEEDLDIFGFFFKHTLLKDGHYGKKDFEEILNILESKGLSLDKSSVNLYALTLLDNGSKDNRKMKIETLTEKSVNPTKGALVSDITQERIWQILQKDFLECSFRLIKYAKVDQAQEIEKTKKINILSNTELKVAQIQQELSSIATTYKTIDIVNQTGNSLLFEILKKPLVVSKILKFSPDWFLPNPHKQFPLLNFFGRYDDREDRPQIKNWNYEIDKHVCNLLDKEENQKLLITRLEELLAYTKNDQYSSFQECIFRLKNIKSIVPYCKRFSLISEATENKIAQCIQEIHSITLAHVLFNEYIKLFNKINEAGHQKNEYSEKDELVVKDTKKEKNNLKEICKYISSQWNEHPFFYIPQMVAKAYAKEQSYYGNHSRRNYYAPTDKLSVSTSPIEAVDEFLLVFPKFKELDWNKLYERTLNIYMNEDEAKSILDHFVLKMSQKENKMRKMAKL